MKRIAIILSAAMLISAPAVAQKKVATVAAPPKQVQPLDSLSYALGVSVGSSLKEIPAKINQATFCNAINDVVAGKQKMTAEEGTLYLQKYFTAQQAKASEGTRKAGQDFLAKNKNEAGVVTLPSGLQYKMLREGTGATPTAADEVEVNYRGMLIDGREFDSSYQRGETTTFPLNRVIPGWTEGIQHVKEGGKIKLFIPDNLAYGDRQMQGSIIEPGSTLIFEVELIKVNKVEATIE